jgi:hypothetical protein
MLWLRMMRCWIAQGLGRAVLWVVLLGAAGYAAYKVSDCPQGQTCVQEAKRR